jgi:N-acetylglucosamine kinase-like BadF-type ATPase
VRRPAAAVIAVDGGNSKTDVAIVGHDGTVLAAVRGPTTSHQAVGIERGMDRLAGLVASAAERTGTGWTAADGPIAEVGSYTLAGVDLPSDVRLLRGALAERGFARRDHILNDTFGALRAGTDRPWGLVLICGQGVNAAAIAPDGRMARFAGLGDISGDWGGGSGVGQAGLAAAVRARDGRGPRTLLERTVPSHFKLARPESLVTALYHGRIPHARISELSRVVFETATADDAVARAIVERLAEELSVMAIALIRRLRMRTLDVEVVLAGGVFRADDPVFFDDLTRRIQAFAPAARLVRPSLLPVAGAALLGLDRLVAEGAVPAAATERARAGFARWVPDGG